jgi:hypothetical protein
LAVEGREPAIHWLEKSVPEAISGRRNLLVREKMGFGDVKGRFSPTGIHSTGGFIIC